MPKTKRDTDTDDADRLAKKARRTPATLAIPSPSRAEQLPPTTLTLSVDVLVLFLSYTDTPTIIRAARVCRALRIAAHEVSAYFCVTKGNNGCASWWRGIVTVYAYTRLKVMRSLESQHPHAREIHTLVSLPEDAIATLKLPTCKSLVDVDFTYCEDIRGEDIIKTVLNPNVKVVITHMYIVDRPEMSTDLETCPTICTSGLTNCVTTGGDRVYLFSPSLRTRLLGGTPMTTYDATIRLLSLSTPIANRSLGILFKSGVPVCAPVLPRAIERLADAWNSTMYPAHLLSPGVYEFRNRN